MGVPLEEYTHIAYYQLHIEPQVWFGQHLLDLKFDSSVRSLEELIRYHASCYATDIKDELQLAAFENGGRKTNVRRFLLIVRFLVSPAARFHSDPARNRAGRKRKNTKVRFRNRSLGETFELREGI